MLDQITFDQLPSAVATILDDLAELKEICNDIRGRSDSEAYLHLPWSKSCCSTRSPSISHCLATIFTNLVAIVAPTTAAWPSTMPCPTASTALPISVQPLPSACRRKPLSVTSPNSARQASSSIPLTTNTRSHERNQSHYSNRNLHCSRVSCHSSCRGSLQQYWLLRREWPAHLGNYQSRGLLFPGRCHQPSRQRKPCSPGGIQHHPHANA